MAGAPASAHTSKITPPAAAPGVLERPVLLARLDDGAARRLTVITAGAGFGKSTLLSTWAADRSVAWCTVDAGDASPARLTRVLAAAIQRAVPGLAQEIAPIGATGDGDERAAVTAWAAHVGDALYHRGDAPLTFVVDDVHELEKSSSSVAVIEELVRHVPPSVGIVIASREEAPFPIERLRGQGQVLDLSAADLAFDGDEIRRAAGRIIGDEASTISDALLEVTGGWPAAVRLALEALRGRPAEEHDAIVRGLGERSDSLYPYLASEVLARESSDVRALLATVAPLPWFDRALCTELSLDPALLTTLARRGLFVQPLGAGTGRFSLNALVSDYLLHETNAGPRDEVLDIAARVYVERGHLTEALQVVRARGDQAAVASFLAEHGQALVRFGALGEVADAAAALPDAQRTREIDVLEGEAREILGDWDGALRCLRRAAGSAGELDAGLAWRIGLLHYLRGELQAALEVFDRAASGAGAPEDQAMLLAWRATTHWVRGDADTAGKLGEEALTIARASDDARSLAAAHTVLAMTAMTAGEPVTTEQHFSTALREAIRAGDVIQGVRIRMNHADHLASYGDYDASLTELEEALRGAEVAGFANFRALGLSNRAEVLLLRGMLDEALADASAARDLYTRLGSGAVCYPLSHLGDIHRIRGDFALARASYEQAIRIAEGSGDAQGLAPALAGLARTIALEDLDGARALLERAASQGPGPWTLTTMLAKGWVALVAGERDEAVACGREVGDVARQRRDQAALAEALLLEARATDGDAVTLTDEARAIWKTLGSPLGEARALLTRAVCLGGSEGARSAAQAEQTLAELGARRLARHAGSLAARLESETRPPVTLRMLGGFAVERHDEPVAASEWRSKKARDLLKILATRRGRPVPREELIDILWPEEDPEKVSNRLSVALATVRAVLDPDKAFPAEHLIGGDKELVWLERDHVAVDVEVFLATVEEGLRAHGAEARELLERAEEMYEGELLEEDRYADWPVALREEARAAYVRCARTLAASSEEAGNTDAAVRYLLRIIQRDTYDESAHLSLVRCLVTAGRHGEARRAYRTYEARMAEIDVECAPFPGNGS